MTSVTDLQKVQFGRHHNSKRHKSLQADIPNGCEHVVPPRQYFVEVFEKMRAHEAIPYQGLAGVGRREKIYRLQHCLAAARLDSYRLFLARSAVVTLIQDVSKGLLLVRFVACCLPNLDVMAGTLGVQSVVDDANAVALAQATESVLRTFAAGDEELFEHIRLSTECLTTDSAADELLTEQFLREGRPSLVSLETHSAILPNLKYHGIDGGHATTRLVSRLWRAIPFLEFIMSLLINGTSAIWQLIRHSGEFRNMFVRYAGALDDIDISSVPDAAKHRFLTKVGSPLRRTVLAFDALWCCCAEIVRTRRRGSRESNIASKFLESCTDELCIQFGMMADAADEVIMLNESCCPERYDSSQLASWLENFMRRIRLLFCSRNAVRTGFTHKMMVILRTPRAAHLSNGKLVRLGGHEISSDVLDACFERMCQWVGLTQVTLDAEFPNFDLLTAFRVFDLRNPLVAGSPLHRTYVARVSALMDADADDLRQQLDKTSPLAMHEMSSRRLSVRDAWKAAIGHVPTSRMPTLFMALVRYFAYTGSSCGVENEFALLVHLIDDRKKKILRNPKKLLDLLVTNQGLRTASVQIVTLLPKLAKTMWIRTPKRSVFFKVCDPSRFVTNQAL